MNTQIRLLSDASNYAVVQLEERHFPGVVFQGDSLHILVQDVMEIETLFQNDRREELGECIHNLRQNLAAVKARYEAVCKAHDIALPYCE